MQATGLECMCLTFDGIYFNGSGVDFGGQPMQHLFDSMVAKFGVECHVKDLAGNVLAPLAPTVAAEDVSSPSPKRRRTTSNVARVYAEMLEEVASVSEEGEVVAKVEGNMTCLPTACLNLVRDNDVKLGLEYTADGPCAYTAIQDTFAGDLSFKVALVEALLGDGDFIVHVGKVGDVGHAVAVKSREGFSEFFDPSRGRSSKLPSESLYIAVAEHSQSCAIHVVELLQGEAVAGQVDGDSEGSDILASKAGGLSKGDKEVAKFGEVKGLALKLKRNASPVAKEIKWGLKNKKVLFTNLDKCLVCGGGLYVDSSRISDASVWDGAKWEDVPHGRKRCSSCNRSYKLGFLSFGKGACEHFEES